MDAKPIFQEGDWVVLPTGFIDKVVGAKYFNYPDHYWGLKTAKTEGYWPQDICDIPNRRDYE